MGEALRHLCTHRIEMAVRRVIGMDTHSESGSLSPGSSTKWRIFGVAHQGAQAAQPHAPHQVGLACVEPG
jgi:hypothetical protein